MCIFHKWSKWKQYENRYSFTYLKAVQQGKEFQGIDLRERRFCLKCNQTQDRLIEENIRLNKND